MAFTSNLNKDDVGLRKHVLSDAANSVAMGVYVRPKSSAGTSSHVVFSTAGLAFPAYSAKIGVVVKALSGNAGKFFLGWSSAVSSANGHEIAAGEELFLAVDNTSLLFGYGTAAATRVSFTAI